MSYGDNQPPPGRGDRGERSRPRGSWRHRVLFSTDRDGQPYGYRPHEVLTTRGDEAVGIAQGLQGEGEDNQVVVAGRLGPFTRLTNVADPVRVVDELRLYGILAQPNHVFFAHPVYGNPVYGNPVYGNPVYGNPVYGNPTSGGLVSPNPAYSNYLYSLPPSGLPEYVNPIYGHPVYAKAYEGPKRSSALPKPEDYEVHDLAERLRTPLASGSPQVIVLDSGLAADHWLPVVLQGSGVRAASVDDHDEPDEDGDGYLDPVAGHGTFIAGVVNQLALGCDTVVHRVLSTFGDGDEWTIAGTLEDLVPLAEPERTVFNLSFGGFVLDHPFVMAWAIHLVREHGAQVVASAGNDGINRPSYPAALPGVIGVGALGLTGPAPFTNTGEWVDACAPGTNLLSTFFRGFDGPAEKDATGFDPDDFDGWAVWSGTSFSAPVVVGNLARIMLAEPVSAAEAAQRLLDPPAMLRVPYLGTVVNFL